MKEKIESDVKIISYDWDEDTKVFQYITNDKEMSERLFNMNKIYEVELHNGWIVDEVEYDYCVVVFINNN